MSSHDRTVKPLRSKTQQGLKRMFDSEAIGLRNGSFHTSVFLDIVTIPRKMVRLERMSHYRHVILDCIRYNFAIQNIVVKSASHIQLGSLEA